MRKRALGKIAAICSLFLPLNHVEAATYGSGACPNTQKNWRSFDRSFEFPNWDFIQIEEHRYRWNDQPASKNELIGYLKQIPQLDPQPLIILIPSKSATCEAVISPVW